MPECQTIASQGWPCSDGSLNRPQGGPRRRWRDTIRGDLKRLDIREDRWYREVCASRSGWKALYNKAVSEECLQQQRESQPSNQVQCEQCHRQFRREGDLKRHKCIAERQKPIDQQRGATQCPVCKRWFCSRGGKAVHRCRPKSQ